MTVVWSGWRLANVVFVVAAAKSVARKQAAISNGNDTPKALKIRMSKGASIYGLFVGTFVCASFLKARLVTHTHT